jgi:hypothetical protein
MARVLLGGRRGVVIRGGGMGGMVLGLVLRRFLRNRARQRGY